MMSALNDLIDVMDITEICAIGEGAQKLKRNAKRELASLRARIAAADKLCGLVDEWGRTGWMDEEKAIEYVEEYRKAGK